MSMNDMLLKGGDTDTNGAIIGGLLGAAYGF
jgi:ADP-ribosylglycohydrolase